MCVLQAVVKVRPIRVHLLKLAPSEKCQNLSLGGGGIAPSAGIAGFSAADLRGIIKPSLAPDKFIGALGRRYNGPQQALASHDATRVRFVFRTRSVRAWRGGRARRPSRPEEGSNRHGDRCTLCPVRGGG